MKIVCISDTHGKHDEVTVPDGDLLIHAGDCTIYGTSGDLKDFLKWFAALPHQHKILIAGNHDWIFERDPEKASRRIQFHAPNIIYLEHAGVRIEGFYIWGSPYTPWFCDWAFNRQRGKELQDTWALIPDYTDILVTHGPVAGGRDWAPFSKAHVGDQDLRERLRWIRPKLHICGHIHDAYGKIQLDSHTLEINASVVNEAYEVVNNPVVIEMCDHCKQVLTGDELLDGEIHGRCY